jgi:hypothetical protein
VRVDLAAAQELFLRLPLELQIPSLSPAYAEADGRRDPTVQPLFLAWRRGDGFLMHVVHEAPIPGEHLRDWQSPYGYGGPLAQALTDEDLAIAWRELDDAARSRRVVAEFVRFHPLAHNERHYPGAVRDDRAVVAVDVASPDLLDSYSGRARTAVRKAQKTGLSARWETSESALAQFPGFYRAAMLEMGADPFYLFDDAYFAAVLALPAARVLTVLLDERAVSMGLFLFGPSIAEYLLSGTTSAGRAAGATNLLIHCAATRAAEEGLVRLYLGGGTNSADDNPLLNFKASFATPALRFRTGHRIHDPLAYECLRAKCPERAGSSRVLFYRGG